MKLSWNSFIFSLPEISLLSLNFKPINHMTKKIIIKGIILTVFALGALTAQQQDTIVLRQGLTLPLLRGYGETIIAPNPVEASLATGKWRAPREGDEVTFVNGEERA